MDCFACARNDGVETRATPTAVIARLDRAIQYSEAAVIEPRSRGVLDTPLARGMTIHMIVRSSVRPGALTIVNATHAVILRGPRLLVRRADVA